MTALHVMAWCCIDRLNRYRDVLLLSGALLGIAGCERAKPSSHGDSARAVAAADSELPPPAAETAAWIPDVGPALLVEGNAPDEAIVVGGAEGDSLDTVLRSLSTA